jgi:hypothetical protein
VRRRRVLVELVRDVAYRLRASAPSMGRKCSTGFARRVFAGYRGQRPRTEPRSSMSSAASRRSSKNVPELRELGPNVRAAEHRAVRQNDRKFTRGARTSRLIRAEICAAWEFILSS